MSEEEIEILTKELQEKEHRLRNAVADIERREDAVRAREEDLRQQEQTRRDFDQIERSLQEREAELSKREEDNYEKMMDHQDVSDSLAKEMAEMRREIETLKRERTLPSRQPTTFRQMGPSNTLGDETAPRVSFKEAIETVPRFDGYNMPLAQFARACRRALETVPPFSERNLTRLLMNKLDGRAYYAVEDEPCDTITQLLDLLSGAFGAPKTIDQYRGELSTVYMRPFEHMLDYIIRVKDLRSSILDEERRIRGSLGNSITADVDNLTARSFCDGLPLEYRLQFRTEHHCNPFAAFSHAKVLAKRMELDRKRYEPRRRADPPQPKTGVHPIGSPQAQSTPAKSPATITAPGTNSSSPSPEPSGATPKICKYCKYKGHVIEECRKLQFHNSRNFSGNRPQPSGTPGEPREAAFPRQHRPVRAIETDEINEEVEPEESESEESQC